MKTHFAARRGRNEDTLAGNSGLKNFHTSGRSRMIRAGQRSFSSSQIHADAR